MLYHTLAITSLCVVHFQLCDIDCIFFTFKINISEHVGLIKIDQKLFLSN